MTVPTLQEVRAGRIQVFERPTGKWRSAIEKLPAPSIAFLAELGVQGDQQADRKHHGGADKAVLAYCAEHYPSWNSEGLPFTPGAFGENLVIAGQSEADVCIGDVYRMGDVLVQVSQPRQPCQTPARWHGIASLMKLMIKTYRCGWYVRVLQPGWLTTPCPVVLEARPNPQWPVLRALRLKYEKTEPASVWGALAELPQLSKAWKQMAAENAVASLY